MDGVTILRTGYDWICYPNGLDNLNGIEEQLQLFVRAPQEVSFCCSILCLVQLGLLLRQCNMWFVGIAITDSSPQSNMNVRDMLLQVKLSMLWDRFRVARFKKWGVSTN